MTSAMSAHPWVWPSISGPCHQAPVSAWGALHVTSYLEHEDWWHQYGNDGDYASHIISCRGENVTICYKNMIKNVSSGGKRSPCVTCPVSLTYLVFVNIDQKNVSQAKRGDKNICCVFGPRQGNRHEDISDDHNRLSQHENQIVTQPSTKLISLSGLRKHN